MPFGFQEMENHKIVRLGLTRTGDVLAMSKKNSLKVSTSQESFLAMTVPKETLLRSWMVFVLMLCLALLVGCGSEPSQKWTDRTTQVSCGMCQFGADHKGCMPSVRREGQIYPLVGIEKQSMEEMHQPGGYCVSIREARLSGEFKGQQFYVSAYELLPLKPEAEVLPAKH